MKTLSAICITLPTGLLLTILASCNRDASNGERENSSTHKNSELTEKFPVFRKRQTIWQENLRTISIKTDNPTIMMQYSFNASGNIVWHTVITLDKKGSPLGAEVFDEFGVKKFIVVFGHRKSDGSLVEELLLPLRTNEGFRLDKKNWIRRVVYGDASANNESDSRKIYFQNDRDVTNQELTSDLPPTCL